MRSYGQKLKVSKCKLFRKETQYLGRVVSADGIKADPEKLSPRDMKEVRSFLWFASYYRDCIEIFMVLAEPLQQLVVTTKGIKFEWGEAQKEAFQGITKANETLPGAMRQLADREVYR